jgi:hypothetical protein
MISVEDREQAKFERSIKQPHFNPTLSLPTHSELLLIGASRSEQYLVLSTI